MKKKDLVFIIGLTIIMGVLWMAGFLVMGLWIPVTVKAHRAWLIFIVVTTLTISVWHSMKEDESDDSDPRKEKYRRKTAKKSGEKNRKKKNRKK